ncbi:hypothetical protein FBQ87_10390 [Sphingobacteriales bacterium CHB3]|nr:hypothetical protein [Sphingobacteriales bacterium CHB3]
MILKYLLAWFLLLVAAVTNGIIRQSFFIGRMEELHAHQLSTFTGILLFALIIWGLSRIWPLESASQAWTIGFIWLGMTLAFEFLFFHYVGGKSWDVLLHDYNILEGRVWPLILVWVTVAPYIFYRFGKG